MPKTSPFGILRIDPETHAMLTKAAKENGQFVSWLANKVLREWLESQTIQQGKVKRKA